MREISNMADRTIRVGIDDAPPAPMQLGSPDTDDFGGYEVDLLKEIAQRAGFQLSFRRAFWSLTVSELLAGNVDLVCSAAPVTKERECEVDFCTPPLSLALAVVKRVGIVGDTAIGGLWLGVRRGTTAEAYARKHGSAEPRQVSESNEKLYVSLAAGELDAVIGDSSIAKYSSIFVPGLQFTGVLPGTKAAYAIMVRKGNDKLRAKINRALKEMANDGSSERSLSKWFGDGLRREANR